jgi:BirA family biotin operon repressor/biotin-[acetyl-CoA-carboxylase] ligase
MKLEHYHFPILPSTQVFARGYMHCLQPGGYSADQWFLFSADTQTRAEGTRKRAWHSPPGNLCATFAFCIPKTHKDALIHISQVSVVALAEAVEAIADIKPTIKWINDLLINQKKVAGILCESFSSPAFMGYYVILVGIGLNINLSRAECATISQPATSLLLETGKEPDKKALLDQIGLNLHVHIARLLDEGFDYFTQRLTYFNLQKVKA